MELALAVVGACALLFSALLSSAVIALELTRGLSRRFRRGGGNRPPASHGLSPATTYTTGVTLTSAAFSSSDGEPGGASGVLAILPTPPRPSSTGARGFSGTAASVGTSPGQRHGLAG